MVRRGEATVLLLLGLPTAAIDWQIAATWKLPVWISLLAEAVALAAVAGVLLVPAVRAAGSAFAVGVLYGLPVLGAVIKWHLAPTATALIGDGAYQMQIGRELVMRGVDPYGFNYVGTGMERTPWGQPFPNPALHHFDYWPGTIMLPLPLQATFKAIFGWWDERIWLLLAAIAVWILLTRIAPGAYGRMAAIAFFLIPGHSLLAVLGDNDLPMVALLLAAALAISGRRWLWVGIFVGLAIATKQTALIVLPTLVVYALVARAIDWKQFLRVAAIAAGMVAMLFAPFLFWNAGAFIADTIVFNFGGGPETYPIQGIGLSSWLLQAGIIRGARDAFPFLAIQLPLVLGAWAVAWRWFRNHVLAGDALLWMGVAFFVFLFANRFSQPAYLLLGVELMLAGLIARLRAPATASTHRPIAAAA